MKNSLQYLFNSLGYKISRNDNNPFKYPAEFTKKDIEIFNFVNEKKITMISYQRMFANMLVAKNIIQNNIEGDFIECGVWKGGSTLLVKLLFDEYKINNRVWLFDTFEGMTEPSIEDVKSTTGENAINKFLISKKNEYVDWCYASIEEVQKNFVEAGVNLSNCNFIKGDVENTIPKEAKNIDKISFLRLDTDWYESTKIELKYLYPKIIKKGFLIIDDYGRWDGSKKAVDEYFEKMKIQPLKSMIDYSSRLIVV